MREIILIFFLTTSNIVYAWRILINNHFLFLLRLGMTSDETIPQTTASRFCNCSTNTIYKAYTVKMEDMIKKGKWGYPISKKLQEISDLCATGDYE